MPAAPFDWLSPFSIFTGIALVLGYALLGSCWLVFCVPRPCSGLGIHGDENGFSSWSWPFSGWWAHLHLRHPSACAGSIFSRHVAYDIPLIIVLSSIGSVDRGQKAHRLGPVRDVGNHLRCRFHDAGGKLLAVSDPLFRHHSGCGSPGSVAEIPLLWGRDSALPCYLILHRHGLLDNAGKGLICKRTHLFFLLPGPQVRQVLPLPPPLQQ